MLTELEAVNMALAAIRERPVSSLDGLNDDAELALQTLRQESTAVQTSGYDFNTEWEVRLTPDSATSKITLAADVLRVEFDPRTFTDSLRPVQRGQSLFNAATGVDTFTDSYLEACRLIRDLVWDNLPEAARNYIARRAARVFASKIAGDAVAIQTAGFEEQEALRTLQHNHAQTRKPNAYRGRWARNALTRYS